MNEYLRIQNFGPVVDIELDNIVPLTVLIGESGSGKSTVMKVLSMFRWIYKRVVLRSYVRQAKIKKTGIGIQMKTLLKTSQLNEYLLPIIEETPPPSTKGKYIRIKYVTQLASPTPSFAFFVNLPQYIKEGYRRFLENKIRDRWDFHGVPLQLFFRQK